MDRQVERSRPASFSLRRVADNFIRAATQRAVIQAGNRFGDWALSTRTPPPRYNDIHKNDNRRSSGVMRHYGSSSSAHLSGFGGTRRNAGKAGKRALTKGAGYETTTAGTISTATDHVLYVGHSTWPAARIVRTMCAALARTAYQRLGIDLNRMDSIIPPHALVTAAGFTYNGQATFFREERTIDNFTPGTTTLDVMAQNMARTVLRTMYQYYDGAANAARAPVLWNSFFLAHQANSQLAVTIPLGDLLMFFDLASQLTLQNVSYSGAVATDPDVDQETNVRNIVLNGFHYKGYGNHMQMKGDRQVTYRAGTNEPPLLTDRDSGVLFKRNALPETGNDMDTNVVKPYQWQNVTRAARVVLDPGTAKKDYISQKKTVTWQKMLDSLLAAGTNTGDTLTAENGVLAANWSNHGKFSCFGLEKIIKDQPPSAQQLQCMYEVHQTILASVVKVFRTPSVAKQVAQQVDLVQA